MRTHTPNRRARLALQALEGRDMMSVTSVTLTNGTLQVIADNAADNVEIRQTVGGLGSKLTVTDKTMTANNSWAFNAANVQRIVVKLNGGDDRLDSAATKPT